MITPQHRQQFNFINWDQLKTVSLCETRNYFNQNKGVTYHSIYSIYSVPTTVSTGNVSDSERLLIAVSLAENSTSDINFDERVIAFGKTIDAAIANLERDNDIKRYLSY